MIDSNFRFNLHRLRPDTRLQGLIKQSVESWERYTPSDAFFTISMEKTGGQIKAICRVASKATSIIVEEMASDPKQLLRRLDICLKKEIKKWRAQRGNTGSTPPLVA